MAATATASLRERATVALSGVSAEALVLAAAFPILFIHLRYQPKFHVAAGSTTVGVELSDFAVLAVVVAAVIAGVRRGFAPLRRGLPLWIAAAFYFVWIGVEILIPHGSSGYAGAFHRGGPTKRDHLLRRARRQQRNQRARKPPPRLRQQPLFR